MHIDVEMSRASQGINEKTGDGRKIHFPTEIAGYRRTDCLRKDEKRMCDVTIVRLLKGVSKFG
jgi:hypothetical protein